MKTILPTLLLLVGFQATAQAQVTPADMPAVLDLIAEEVAETIHKMIPSARGLPVFVDAASLPAIQKTTPGLSKLPAEGRHYRALPDRQPARGIVLTVSNSYTGGLGGEPGHAGRVNFLIQSTIIDGKEVDTIVLAFAKQQGKWTVVDGLILADAHH